MSFTFFSFSKVETQTLRGFTLIELLVSISIIGILTGLVVFNHGDLTDEISVGNVAHDISLQIRQAQVYGISVRELAPTSNQFSIAYGIDLNLGSSGSNAYFHSFADQGAKNGYYDTPGSCAVGSSECLIQSALMRGNTILSVCVIPASGPEVCSPAVSRVAITFLRPDPSARIVFFDAGGSVASYPGYKGADIQVRSPKGLVKHVYVYTTGQISVP